MSGPTDNLAAVICDLTFTPPERALLLAEALIAAGYVHKDDAIPAPVGDVGALIANLHVLAEIIMRDPAIDAAITNTEAWPINVHVFDTLEESADALSALSQGEEREPLRETFWVREWPASNAPGQGYPQPRYWGPRGWEFGIENAYRFCREQDVAAAIGRLDTLPGVNTEHVLIGGAILSALATEQAIRADERERCAKIADASAEYWRRADPKKEPWSPAEMTMRVAEAVYLAAAIRAASPAAAQGTLYKITGVWDVEPKAVEAWEAAPWKP